MFAPAILIAVRCYDESSGIKPEFPGILDAGRRSFARCASGASTNYLHRTPGDGPLLGRPPFLKRYATGSSLSKKPASATHSPSRNCGPGNGILSGTASMGCTRRECSFIGKMTSRRCSRAQPLNTLLTEKASPLRQSANVIRASSAWARGGGRARARRDQLARPAPFRGMRCKVRRLVLTSLSVGAHRLPWGGWCSSMRV